MQFHVTHKDGDVRACLLALWQHCIAGVFKDDTVQVIVHSCVDDNVRWQCGVMGRMDPPFVMHIYKDNRLYQSYYRKPRTLPQRREYPFEEGELGCRRLRQRRQ